MTSTITEEAESSSAFSRREISRNGLLSSEAQDEVHEELLSDPPHERGTRDSEKPQNNGAADGRHSRFELPVASVVSWRLAEVRRLSGWRR